MPIILQHCTNCRFSFIFVIWAAVFSFNTIIIMGYFINYRTMNVCRIKSPGYSSNFRYSTMIVDHPHSELILPPRLLQIAEPLLEISKIQVNRWNSVADIGADHGLLACYLAEKYFPHVYAIDRSDLSLIQCKQNVAKRALQNVVQIYLGNGFTPLLSSDTKTDVAIMAGTSATTMASILGGTQIDAGQNAFLGLNNKISITSAIESNLKQLEVKCLVLQPWPAELMHFLQLSSLLDVCGWKIVRQEIGASNPRTFQLTSFYQPKTYNYNRNNENITSSSCAEIFQMMPIVKSTKFCEESNKKQHSIWIQYLKKQQQELSRRVLKTKNISSKFDYEQQLRSISESSLCTEDTKECINVLLAIENYLCQVQFD